MDPLTVRVSQIIDFGKVVTIVGTDLQSNMPIMVHVDHRPFQSVWQTCQPDPNFPPLNFQANGLVMNLEISPDLTEIGSAG
jgi:hypothetical protein